MALTTSTDSSLPSGALNVTCSHCDETLDTAIALRDHLTSEGHCPNDGSDRVSMDPKGGK